MFFSRSGLWFFPNPGFCLPIGLFGRMIPGLYEVIQYSLSLGAGTNPQLGVGGLVCGPAMGVGVRNRQKRGFGALRCFLTTTRRPRGPHVMALHREIPTGDRTEH